MSKIEHSPTCFPSRYGIESAYADPDCPRCRLNKAAPKLLAACKELMSAFDVPLITKHNDPGFVRLRALQKAEAAIREAEKEG